MDYLRTFATLADYEAYVSTPHPQPLTAYIEATDEVIFEPLEDGEEKNWLQSIELKDATGSGDLNLLAILNKTAHVDFPSTVTSIGNQVFQNCDYLKEVTFPEGLLSIGNNSFHNCKALTKLVFPNTLTSIGENAFNTCTGLTNIEIGTGITNIGYLSFRQCRQLVSVTIKATNPPTFSDCFYDTNDTFIIYVPAESVETYQTASGWSTYAARIQAIPSV